MATRIRLRRLGAKKRPFYRVVVADQRAPRDGRFIENIGKYHPLDHPSLIEIDEERALHWLRVGAQPSSQVRNLMVKTGIWDRFVAERPSAASLVKARTDKPTDAKVSKKAAAKAAARAEAPPAPVEAPVEAPVASEPIEADTPPAPIEESTPTPVEEATPASVDEPVAEPEVEPAVQAQTDAESEPESVTAPEEEISEA